MDRQQLPSLVWKALNLYFRYLVFLIVIYGAFIRILVEAQGEPSDTVTITTPLGEIRGFRQEIPKTDGTASVQKFLGIPFAEPPIEALRFKPPKAHMGWRGELDATKTPPGCVGKMMAPKMEKSGENGQDMMAEETTTESSMDTEGEAIGVDDGDSMGNGGNQPKAPPMTGPMPLMPPTSEDCLYLNIISPLETNTAQQASLPVVIFLHAGSFVTGHPLKPDLTNFAIETNAIVVSIAYRLHVYGFFTIKGNMEYKGNLALWDQVLGMQWVRDNIAAFGGDPRRVTLSGYSAGGSSVSMHIASPASRDLFQAAISWSGTQLDFKAYNTYSATSNLLSQIGCTEDDKKCIRGALQSDIDAKSSGLTFMPVYDGKFFPSDPWKLIVSGRYNNVPLMVGFNSDEGLSNTIRALRSLGNDVDVQNIKESFVQFFKRGMPNFYDFSMTQPKAMDIIMQLLETKYISDRENTSSVLRGTIDMLSDFFMSYPVSKFVNAIAEKQSQVYLYYFNHTPSAVKGVYESNLKIPVGAGHVEPVHLLFGTNDKPLTDYEQRLVRNYLYSIQTFIYTMEPRLVWSGGQEAEEWPAYTVQDGNYVEVGGQNAPTTFSIKPSFPVERVRFWESDIPTAMANLQKDAYIFDLGQFWTQLILLLVASLCAVLIVVVMVMMNANSSLRRQAKS